MALSKEVNGKVVIDFPGATEAFRTFKETSAPNAEKGAVIKVVEDVLALKEEILDASHPVVGYIGNYNGTKAISAYNLTRCGVYRDLGPEIKVVVCDEEDFDIFERLVSQDPALLKRGILYDKARPEVIEKFEAFMSERADLIQAEDEPVKNADPVCVKTKPDGSVVFDKKLALAMSSHRDFRGTAEIEGFSEVVLETRLLVDQVKQLGLVKGIKRGQFVTSWKYESPDTTLSPANSLVSKMEQLLEFPELLDLQPEVPLMIEDVKDLGVLSRLDDEKRAKIQSLVIADRLYFPGNHAATRTLFFLFLSEQIPNLKRIHFEDMISSELQTELFTTPEGKKVSEKLTHYNGPTDAYGSDANLFQIMSDSSLTHLAGKISRVSAGDLRKSGMKGLQHLELMLDRRHTDQPMDDQEVVDFIRSNQGLKVLNLHDSYMTPESFVEIVDQLPELEALDMTQGYGSFHGSPAQGTYGKGGVQSYQSDLLDALDLLGVLKSLKWVKFQIMHLSESHFPLIKRIAEKNPKTKFVIGCDGGTRGKGTDPRLPSNVEIASRGMVLYAI